MAALRFG